MDRAISKNDDLFRVSKRKESIINGGPNVAVRRQALPQVAPPDTD
jgi:hypothetical protein